MAKNPALNKAQQKAQQLHAYKAALKKAKPFALPVTDKKIVVSLGWKSAVHGALSRHFPLDAWQEVRVDADAAAAPDLISSLHHIPEIADASVDGVWINHVLQRLSFHEAASVLVEATRLLKDGGELLVAVPDMQLAANFLARAEGEAEMFRAPAGVVTAVDMMYGFQRAIEGGDATRIHKSGYSAESLGYFVRGAGLCNLHVQRHPYDLVALGKKLPYGHPDRVERIVMIGNSGANTPAVPEAVRPAQAQVIRFTDKLEDAPKRWKPLGLLKS
jgi:hypothetical protein